jgi:hypothetical protein
MRLISLFQMSAFGESLSLVTSAPADGIDFLKEVTESTWPDRSTPQLELRINVAYATFFGRTHFPPLREC